MNKGRKHTVIDIFAGCGGLSLGLYQAGWHGIFAVEKNPDAFATLKYNLIDKCRHFDWPEWLPKEPLDIVRLNEEYTNKLCDLRGRVDLVAGGPPCQGFSMAGQRIEDDERNRLIFSYIKFIANVRPKLLLFENVKGFTYAFNKGKNPNAVPYSKIVTEELCKLGYDVNSTVIDFSEFGVPQRRKRFILIGVLNGEKRTSQKFLCKLKENFLPFIKSCHLTEQPSVEDALSDLLRSTGETDTPDRKGYMSGLYGQSQTPYQKYLRKGIPKSKKVPDSHSFAHHKDEKIRCFNKLLSEYPFRGKRIAGDYRKEWNIRQRSITVLDSHTVSPTITGLPDDYLHYCEPRILTVRECARLQSFPDWFEFKSKYTTGGKLRKKEVPRYSQVGNAIPPLFAYQLGNVLKEMCYE